MVDANKTARIQYRNINIVQIRTYRFPLAAIVSILHRISGALLFLCLPFLLYLLDRSLISEIGFDRFKSFTSNLFVKLILLALIWAYLHHFVAGIRYLLMDIHIGLEKHQAKNSSIVVFAVSLPLAALFALKLFGAF